MRTGRTHENANAVRVGARCVHGSRPARAADVIRIGVLNDRSGLYADFGGRGSVEAAKLAIEEFGGSVLGKKVKVVSADHQNKSDIGLAVARQWFENDDVQMITDLTNSAIAIGVQNLAKDCNVPADQTAAPRAESKCNYIKR